MSTRSTVEFLKTESGSGLVLVAAAALGVLWANSPWADAYFGFTGAKLTLQVGGFSETMSVLKWIKNGLMPVFFLVVGLEIKHEILRGELSNPRRLALPVLAALGGVLVPALIYVALNLGAEGRIGGWPIPTATDIAFALAVLALAAPKAPPSLRVFLMTLAIVDDLAAVLLIAGLFTQQIHLSALAGALATLGALAALSRWPRAPYMAYAAGFVILWAFTLKSGVNASVAGVAAGMVVPVDPRRPGQVSPLKLMMAAVHPYVAFGILPLFAFAAAGFSFATLDAAAIVGPAPLGIALGLFVGKQAGVFGAAALAVSSGVAKRPTGAHWSELYGVALLCGVGFTMSLFIGGLAFDADSAVLQTKVRLGVIAGSLTSALIGAAVLRWTQRRREEN